MISILVRRSPRPWNRPSPAQTVPNRPLLATKGPKAPSSWFLVLYWRGVFMQSRWRPLAVWLAVLSVGLGEASARAQTVTASVTGSVRDASEAIVPGATVQIRNHDTNQVWETVTD